MTATNELRRLLDELCVEWTYGDGTVSYANGEHWCHAWSYSDDAMCVSMGYFTPEQAISATLSNGECEVELRESGWGGYTRHCGNCGADLDCDTRNKQNYCPNCGKAVKR